MSCFVFSLTVKISKRGFIPEWGNFNFSDSYYPFRELEFRNPDDFLIFL